MVRTRSVQDNRATLAETYVKLCVERMGCEFLPADSRTAGIDGHLRIIDNVTGSHLTLAVQVKSGIHYTRAPYSDPKFVHLAFDKEHVLDWHLSNLPVILVWVLDPDIQTPPLWCIASKIRLGSGRVRIRRSHVFDSDARAKLRDIASHAAGRPDIPLLHGPMLGNYFDEAKTGARKFYDTWRAKGSVSPKYGHVGVTLKGWRHITRHSASKNAILHKLSLLPCAKELIEVCESGLRVRVLREVGPRIELHMVRGLIRVPYRRDILLAAMLELRTTHDGRKRAKFYSLYERYHLGD
jgi:hypothetical protein